MKPLYSMHTAILVSDLARSQYFYGTVLRLPQVERPATMSFPGCWYQLGDYQIHLILDETVLNETVLDETDLNETTLGETTLGETILDKTTAQQFPTPLRNCQKWGRNNHLAIAIADIEATRTHLHAHDWPMQDSASGRPAVFVQDPDGNVIELQAVNPATGTS